MQSVTGRQKENSSKLHGQENFNNQEIAEVGTFF
jgi:hypothetical protein